ncbi:unnamed protein product, partial [Hydatigera taeniaeformis]|uniref:Fibrous sheath-interacting protein 1 n=1 Tax=Hydatigena taeniaeformis TaxID=6205 RepID=A0A0R3WS95_HYDTA
MDEQNCPDNVDVDDMRRTVTALKENVEAINRALCSQISATNIEKQLLGEIQDMKLQLCELSESLKHQTSVSVCDDMCGQASCVRRDSRLQLSRDIEEIKCCLQHLTAGLGCSSPPLSCPKCGSPPCESLRDDNNDEVECKSESPSPLMECQMAVQISECDDVTPKSSINQFVLDKVEGLKTSIKDAIATEKCCSENEYCAHSAREKDEMGNVCSQDVASSVKAKTSIERIFQILQDLESILSADKSNLSQDRALVLVCTLKHLLESEFSTPNAKADDEWTLQEGAEQYIYPPPHLIAPSPCMMDGRRHPDSSSHKGSSASLCGSGVCNHPTFPLQNDPNENLDTKIKNLLRELYCELQSFDEEVKAKVLSMLEEISETLEALQSCQQNEIAISINICPNCEGNEGSMHFDTCGLPSTPQDGMMGENRPNCQPSIIPTPNLCSLVTELQSLIQLLEPSAQLSSDYDFESNLSSTLSSLKEILQEKCNDPEVLESIGNVLQALKEELCQQGAKTSVQVAIISELEELLTPSGVTYPQGRDVCQSDSALCCREVTIPSETYDVKVLTILDSIEGCIREVGSCCPKHAEALQSTRNGECTIVGHSNASAPSCAEEVEYKSPAVVCAEAINSRVALVLAELKGVVQTLEVEGSTLHCGTISKIFYIFGQIECILAADQQNASTLMEIKQILGRIKGRKVETVSECPIADCTAPSTNADGICEIKNQKQLSTMQSEGCAVLERSASITLCPVHPTNDNDTPNTNCQDRCQSSTMHREAYAASDVSASSTICPAHPTNDSDNPKCNCQDQSRKNTTQSEACAAISSPVCPIHSKSPSEG